MPSKAAKVAAVMAFTSNVASYETALDIYEWMEDNKGENLEDAFPCACRWGPLNAAVADWANLVEELAQNFDNAVKHFQAPDTHTPRRLNFNF